MRRNKWGKLPLLNTARRFPGSILLQSKIAFCFCGHHQGLRDYLNSIESLQLDWNGNWTTLPRDNRIAKTFHLAAASLFNSIVLFGGREYTSCRMYFWARKQNCKKTFHRMNWFLRECALGLWQCRIVEFMLITPLSKKKGWRCSMERNGLFSHFFLM